MLSSTIRSGCSRLGETSGKFTCDADAVVVESVQDIDGAKESPFKVPAGTIEVKDGKDGNSVEKLRIYFEKELSMRKLGVFLVIILVVGSILYIVAVLDPFGWGVVQSDRFSWEEFGKIKKGDRIERVLEQLGRPLRPAEDFVVLTDDLRDPCTAGGCKKYIFAGATWGANFKEAIVIADPQGYVLHSVARQE